MIVLCICGTHPWINPLMGLWLNGIWEVKSGRKRWVTGGVVLVYQFLAPPLVIAQDFTSNLWASLLYQATSPRSQLSVVWKVYKPWVQIHFSFNLWALSTVPQWQERNKDNFYKSQIYSNNAISKKSWNSFLPLYSVWTSLKPKSVVKQEEQGSRS